MILLGLTGGIGSGKSTVSSMLAALGAVIIDADAIVKELQEPGEPLLAELAAEFGASILREDGSLDRLALAGIAFADKEKVAALNKIVHPAVGREMNRRLEEQRGTDNVVVLDIPLLAENPREGLCGVIVVDVPVDTAVGRLMEQRGFSEEDARARIANQTSREKRMEIADKVIDNAGSLDELRAQVDEVWRWAVALPPAAPDAGRQAPREEAPEAGAAPGA
ncbi:MAG: dephospho-CoA kinase [Actinomycetota bacterium]